ncbi:hypothetical protein EATA6166_04330 [Enterobacter asburiae]|nr:hypothetical protein EATA6166_04330 [Enterobacter asburiae]
MLNSHFESTLLGQYFSVGAGSMVISELWTLIISIVNIKIK